MTHRPKRDDEIAAWLKRQRDLYAESRYESDRSYYCYDALDDLLDDYRLHADTRTPLTEDVEGPPWS